jgi:hypothetical protein
MRKEIQILEHKGEKILFLDFSNCTSKGEFIPVIDAAKQWLQNKDPNSVLTLTDVTNAHYNAEILTLFKELTLHNKPYVKAGAIVGITRPLMKLAYNTIMAFSKRSLPMFDTHDQAKEWLIKQ